MNTRTFYILLLLLPVLPLAARDKESDFLKWVDDKGTINFVDDITKIPPEFRGRAQPIDGRHTIDAHSKSSVFSFRPGSKQVIISAKINERPTVRMWINPAVAQSVISVKTAKELGIDVKDASLQKIDLETPSGKVPTPIVKLETVDLQGRIVRNLYMAINDIAESESYVGILGQDFLANFRVNLDQPGGRLTLEDKMKH